MGNNNSSINLLFTDFYRFDKIYGGKLRIFTAGNAIFMAFYSCKAVNKKITAVNDVKVDKHFYRTCICKD